MKPDRNNYELWLVDYFDGNLGSDQVRQLFEFLDSNTDIKDEFGDLMTYSLNPEETSFKNKDNLRKTPPDLNDTQFELLCIASCENDISKNQEKELEEIILKDPDRRKTFDQFRKTRLVAPSSTYRYKFKLRKLTPAQRFIRYPVIGISVAATILLMVTIFRQPAAVDPLKEKTIVADNKINKSAERKDKIGIIEEAKAKNEVENKVRRILPVAMNDEPYNLHISDSVLPQMIINRDIVFKVTTIKEFDTDSKLQSYSLIAMNFAEAAPRSEEEPSALGSFITRLFREKINKSDSTATGKIKGYEIADAGINGLNKLLGWEMTLAENRDQNGQLISVSFNSKLLKFSAPVKKSTPSE